MGGILLHQMTLVRIAGQIIKAIKIIKNLLTAKPKNSNRWFTSNDKVKQTKLDISSNKMIAFKHVLDRSSLAHLGMKYE